MSNTNRFPLSNACLSTLSPAFARATDAVADLIAAGATTIARLHADHHLGTDTLASHPSRR